MIKDTDSPRLKKLKRLKVQLASMAESLELVEKQIDRAGRFLDSLEKMMTEEDKFEGK